MHLARVHKTTLLFIALAVALVVWAGVFGHA